MNDGYVSIYYGRVTHDSQTTQYKGFFIPWQQKRRIRKSYYGQDGAHLFDEPKKHSWIVDFESIVPKEKFKLIDFDGEEIEATTHITEMEWRQGEGYFKWLSVLFKPEIQRSLMIEFNKEVGKEKGSWKGGTTGHSIGMLNNTELHDGAMKRYCVKHNLKFIEKIKKPLENKDQTQCVAKAEAINVANESLCKSLFGFDLF